MTNKIAIIGYNQIGQSLHRMINAVKDLEVSYIFSNMDRPEDIFVTDINDILFDPDVKYILECTDDQDIWSMVDWATRNRGSHLISSHKGFWELRHQEIIANFSKKYNPSIPDNPNIWLGSLFALGNGKSAYPTARFKTIQLHAGEINVFRGGTEIAIAGIMIAELRAAMQGYKKMPRN